MERLLRESCNEVLGGARALLLHALSSEGVYLDGSTLVATTLPAKNNQRAGVGAGDAPSDSEYDLSTMASVVSSQSSLCHVPSPRLFRRAEAVRQYMQDELADLLHDVVNILTTSYLNNIYPLTTIYYILTILHIIL